MHVKYNCTLLHSLEKHIVSMWNDFYFYNTQPMTETHNNNLKRQEGKKNHHHRFIGI
jgi:hypothetical protein